MVLGSRDRERFWISLIVRFAFGFMFLTAAINMFFLSWDESLPWQKNLTTDKVKTSLNDFVALQSKAYETSWLNIKVNTGEVDLATGTSTEQLQLGMLGIQYFLYSMPFVFILLSTMLLTGIFLRTGLRLSALYLVMLGIGKYIVDFKTGITMTTFSDFTYALFICMALFATSKESSLSRVEVEEEIPAR
jgi:hypothetical protein